MYDIKKEKELWEQARGELLGFANHLQAKGAGITAAQIKMACRLADFGITTIEKIANFKPPPRNVEEALKDSDEEVYPFDCGAAAYRAVCEYHGITIGDHQITQDDFIALLGTIRMNIAEPINVGIPLG